MNKINGLRDYLLENYVNSYGNLVIKGLDFSDFDGDVFISGMKVKRDLWQGNQKVGGSLWQGNSTVKGNYYCEDIKAGGVINSNEPTKLLKKITRKELSEMGYEVID